MIGEVISYAGQVVPESFLEADGSIVSIASYPELFDAIGDSFGGDGVNDFALPDMSDRYVRAGSSVGAMQSSETAISSGNPIVPVISTGGGHIHHWVHDSSSGFTAPTSARSIVRAYSSGDNASYSFREHTSVANVSRTNSTGAHTHTVTIGASGGDEETRPKTAVVLYCIRYKD